MTLGLCTRFVRVLLRHVDFRLNKMESNIMSALSDAVTRITDSVKNEITAVTAALSNSSSAADPDVAAAVTALNALSDQLDAEAAALNPAPTPDPASSDENTQAPGS